MSLIPRYFFIVVRENPTDLGSRGEFHQVMSMSALFSPGVGLGMSTPGVGLGRLLQVAGLDVYSRCRAWTSSPGSISHNATLHPL